MHALAGRRIDGPAWRSARPFRLPGAGSADRTVDMAHPESGRDGRVSGVANRLRGAGWRLLRRLFPAPVGACRCFVFIRQLQQQLANPRIMGLIGHPPETGGLMQVMGRIVPL